MLYDQQPAGSDDFGKENETTMSVAEHVVKLIISGALPDAVSQTIDADAAIDGVLLGLALVMEQAPETATPRAMRLQTEEISKRLLLHLKMARAAFEREGVHPIALVVEGVGPPSPGAIN